MTWRKVGMCFILNATIHDLFSSQVQNICGVLLSLHCIKFAPQLYPERGPFEKNFIHSFLELTMECNETAKK